MSRRLLTSRRARDLTGAGLLAAGLLTVAVCALVAAFRWDALAGLSLLGGITAGVGFLLGRE
ncbi:hypothetical protein ABZ671_18620 [Micromonospora sp. NPDC006766]|uniref:hypothetical protein n=1 Tax=Micromonospora sp. NPDC006766 TaxID=3154778 RepID=UPI0033D71249